jgi:hypothetical protein
MAVLNFSFFFLFLKIAAEGVGAVGRNEPILVCTYE